jgi:hypothetical protein
MKPVFPFPLRALLMSALLLPLAGRAQENDTLAAWQAVPVHRMFSTGRLSSGPSAEMPEHRNLEFTVAHRFAPLEGAATLFGLDGYANIRFAFEYGLRPRLSAGLGRSREGRTYDGWLKARLLAQREGGEGAFPFSLVLYGNTALSAAPWTPEQAQNLRFEHRLSYVAQVLIARQFFSRLSLQLSPALVHRNLTLFCKEPNTLYLLGAGARLQLSGSLSLLAEYYQPLNYDGQAARPTYPPLNLGLDLSTTRHAFQLHFGNAFALNEQGAFAATADPFRPGGIRFGFGIVRNFRI